MTKVFNTHIEALQFMIAKPYENKVLSRSGFNYYSDDCGEVIRADGRVVSIRDLILPLTAVEPKKSNKELAAAHNIQLPAWVPDQRKLLRNAVNPLIGKYIFNIARELSNE